MAVCWRNDHRFTLYVRAIRLSYMACCTSTRRSLARSFTSDRSHCTRLCPPDYLPSELWTVDHIVRHTIGTGHRTWEPLARSVVAPVVGHGESSGLSSSPLLRRLRPHPRSTHRGLRVSRLSRLCYPNAGGRPDHHRHSAPSLRRTQTGRPDRHRRRMRPHDSQL